MSGSWTEHVDQLLDDGEHEQHRVVLEGATVVVTNRRVLAFTPDVGDSNYRDADRPNVTRVSVETDSAPGRLVWATLYLGLGIGTLLVATTTSAADHVSDLAGDVDEPSGVADAALEAVATVLTAFDLSLLVAGSLLAALGVVFFGRYAASRSRRLVLRVSGDDDLALPVSDADVEADRPAVLEAAIGPGPAPEDGIVGGEASADAGPVAETDESG